MSREHAELLHRLRGLVLSYRHRPADVPREILGFLREFVLDHIECTDLAFAVPIREAKERERKVGFL